MILKSQSMWFVMEAMMDTAKAWTRDKIEGNDTSMNIDPSAPLIVQVGDYGYEVQSCGGDGDIEGFVIMCKPEPVCKWEGMECIRLENKHDTHPPPQREWQGLTDQEADEYWDESVSTGCRLSFGIGVDYANRVLREKNT